MTEFAPSESEQGRTPKKLQFSLTAMLILVVVLAGIFATLRQVLLANRAVECRGNLKNILLAMHNYLDVYECFPPAYIADANGRPIHSWRVLLLPYLDETALYTAYDFSEPWNGPNNRQLASRLPRVYACPASDSSGCTTSYVAVVGQRTAWPGSQSITFRQIRDGTANTILVVEVAASGIHWMEPRDLDISTMSFTVNQVPGTGISGRHPEGGFVGMADGTVHRLPPNLAPGTIRALLTIDDGGPIYSEVWNQ